METTSDSFIRYSGALMARQSPFESPDFDKTDIAMMLKQRKALFCRWTTLITPPCNRLNDSDLGWWYCLRSEPISLETLTAKQRYRVKKGLANNLIFISNDTEIERRGKELYDVYKLSFSDYPAVYRPELPDCRSFIDELKNHAASAEWDVWLCLDKQSERIIGFATTRRRNRGVTLVQVKINPDALKSEINAALGFEICRHYLNESGAEYVCDGERNIRHITAYQDFLVRVLGFEKMQCELHVVYHPMFRPLVQAAYPLRRVMKKAALKSRMLYNLYCLLMQEQYARESRQPCSKAVNNLC